jgi:hypothetical protein
MYGQRLGFGAAVLWSASIVASGEGAILHVRTDGTGDFDQISAACLAAAPGDTVAIWPGDHEEWDGETPTIIHDKPLTLLGWGGGPEDVRARVNFRFIDCGEIVIEGITFHDDVSPILVWYAAVTVRNCRFVDNVGSDLSPAALTVSTDEDVLIEDCVFARNISIGQERDGGAIVSTGFDVSVRRCWFEDNEASGEGGGLGGTAVHELRVEDCVFLRNRAPNGAALWGAAIGNALVEGCTFYANETTSPDGAAVYVTWSGFGLNRCIIAGTVGGYGLGVQDGASLHCFCFWDNERGSTIGLVNMPASYGNFEADPLFCNTEGEDFQLEATSPCVPQEHGGYMCGQIGAYGAGCGLTPVVPTSWGKIKARFWEEAKKARRTE